VLIVDSLPALSFLFFVLFSVELFTKAGKNVTYLTLTRVP